MDQNMIMPDFLCWLSILRKLPTMRPLPTMPLQMLEAPYPASHTTFKIIKSYNVLELPHHC